MASESGAQSSLNYMNENVKGKGDKIINLKAINKTSARGENARDKENRSEQDSRSPAKR